MDKDKLKLIIRNLEMLVDQLKTEVYSDVKSYSYDDIDPIELGYDNEYEGCLLYTSPSPRDKRQSRMPSSA